MASRSNSNIISVEQSMSRHMVRLGLPVSVGIVLISTIIASYSGLISSLIAVFIVLANFAAVGSAIGRATDNSPIAGMVAAIVSFFVILLALTVFVVLAHNQTWLNLRIFGISMIALHLIVSGLEARRVSGKLAYSGIFPNKKEIR